MARLKGTPAPATFRYRNQGSLAQIGKHKAVIDFGWLKLTGTIAWWVWGLAHIYFLIGLRTLYQRRDLIGCGFTSATSAAPG